jgi:serine/threonine-protein kinase RsbW
MTAEFARTLVDGRAGFPGLLEAIEAHLESHAVPPGVAAQLMVALDEIVSNVLDHGGDDGGVLVDVRMKIGSGQVKAEVADNGRPFDPLSTPAPDTSLSLEDRAIGGLGIHLLRELLDDVSYLREGGRNRLRFSKTFPLA